MIFKVVAPREGAKAINKCENYFRRREIKMLCEQQRKIKGTKEQNK
jgi:hypothetical protein